MIKSVMTLKAAQETRKVWELFVTTGNEENLERVRPEIRASWQRSRRAGINPAAQEFPTVLTSEELNCLRQQNVQLVKAAHEVIVSLSCVLTAENFLGGLVDIDGHVLHTYCAPHRYRDKQEAINALPGAGVTERLIGTNAPGIALFLNRPVQVYWFEHYMEFMHRLAGCAAPIYSACGEPLGALVISGYEDVAHLQALNVTIAAARSFEEKVRPFEALAHLAVVEEFNRCLLRYPTSPLLALCPHGHILAVSPAMAKLVTLQSPEQLVGRPLHQVRDFQCLGLFPLAEREPFQSYEASIVFPHKGKTCTSTVVPVQSEGQKSGLVVIASGLSSPATPKSVTKLSWQAIHTGQNIIGNSPVLRRALQLAEKAAAYDWPVLLMGESGTGKELFAQAIHQASRRASGPFVAVNCGTIPKELATSELFGYENGAFSGALRGGRQGKVELAHCGTLFLDEVADIPPEIQLSFLRVLEEGQIVPLGSKYPRAIDVRVIAAMNTDPQAGVAQGKLRLDLYHRLNVFPIVLPPLRERLEDLPLLAHHLLAREGFPHMKVAPEVLKVLRNYDWPGNIRELRNVLIRAAILADDQIITLEALPPELLTPQLSPSLQLLSMHRLEREQIDHALQVCRGNVSRAAKVLGIHRSTLYNHLRKYRL